MISVTFNAVIHVCPKSIKSTFTINVLHQTRSTRRRNQQQLLNNQTRTNSLHPADGDISTDVQGGGEVLVFSKSIKSTTKPNVKLFHG